MGRGRGEIGEIGEWGDGGDGGEDYKDYRRSSVAASDDDYPAIPNSKYLADSRPIIDCGW